MPDLEIQDGTENSTDTGDPLDSIVTKFEQADAKAGVNQPENEDGVNDEDAEEAEDEGTDDNEADSTDTAADTDKDSDEDSESTGDESDEADDTDTGEDEEESSDDDESDDAEDGDEDDEATEGDGEPLSDAAKAALEANGADLKLDDITDPVARKVVEKKLKSVDAALTRSIQRKHRELTETYGAEARYQQDSTALHIVELIERNPELLEQVNRELTKIDPEAEGNDETTIKDAKALLKERIDKHRKDAKQAVDAEISEYDNRVKRTGEMEEFARKTATKAGVPFTRSLEKLIAVEISGLPEAEVAKGLSNEQIEAIVKEYAADHLRSVRAHRREASKQAVQGRTAAKQAPKPSIKPPASTKSPGASRPKPEAVDHNDEESRHRQMLRSARRIKPGVRDK